MMLVRWLPLLLLICEPGGFAPAASPTAALARPHGLASVPPDAFARRFRTPAGRFTVLIQSGSSRGGAPVCALDVSTPGHPHEGLAQAGKACPAAEPPLSKLPPHAAERLRESFEEARQHARHIWRDTPAVHPDGTVTVFVEISAGSHEKHEFDMKTNRLALDRPIPEALGGYPTGYGFLPQTIGLDGDPFDGLVLGDAPSGQLVRGRIVGIMHMTDEKGHDAKIVVVPESDSSARRLDAAERARIAEFFNRYKAEDDDEESWACVSGWGDVEEARRYLDAARRLFERER